MKLSNIAVIFLLSTLLVSVSNAEVTKEILPEDFEVTCNLQKSNGFKYTNKFSWSMEEQSIKTGAYHIYAGNKGDAVTSSSFKFEGVRNSKMFYTTYKNTSINSNGEERVFFNSYTFGFFDNKTAFVNKTHAVLEGGLMDIPFKKTLNDCTHIGNIF